RLHPTPTHPFEEFLFAVSGSQKVGGLVGQHLLQAVHHFFTTKNLSEMGQGRNQKRCWPLQRPSVRRPIPATDVRNREPARKREGAGSAAGFPLPPPTDPDRKWQMGQEKGTQEIA